jgi:hypothetical protein
VEISTLTPFFLFSLVAALGDAPVGAVELEQPKMAEPRVDRDIWRLAGHPAAGDAILHDVERLDAEQAGAVGRAAEDVAQKEGRL